MRDDTQYIAECAVRIAEYEARIAELERELSLLRGTSRKPHRAWSPREISTRSYKVLPWGGAWADAFGHPEVTSTWFISGASASGKSSFVMQLAGELTHYGRVLYLSFEEGVSLGFSERLCRFGLDRCQGRFSVATQDSVTDLRERLVKRHSARFVIVDSYQHSGWEWPETKQLLDDFPRKSFIFISQESKGQPLGKPAVRLRYAADVKVRVVGFKAFCQGRFTSDAGGNYTVWEEGVLRTSNGI